MDQVLRNIKKSVSFQYVWKSDVAFSRIILSLRRSFFVKQCIIICVILFLRYIIFFAGYSNFHVKESLIRSEYLYNELKSYLIHGQKLSFMVNTPYVKSGFIGEVPCYNYSKFSPDLNLTGLWYNTKFSIYFKSKTFLIQLLNFFFLIKYILNKGMNFCNNRKY